MTVGERIRDTRIGLGMTQMELAERMGYKTKSTVCEVEKGGDNLTQRRIVKFAEALGVTPAFLMGWEPEDIDYSYITDGSPTPELDKLVIERLKTTDKSTRDVVMRLLGLLSGEERMW